MGWSRQQAIDYMVANSCLAENNIVNEVDRYLTWPGQALAYKVGQIRISALRAKATQELGVAFDLRDFNDEILATGSVPLAVLEQRMAGWVNRQQGR